MRSIGATIPGPFRRKEGSINQDAFLIHSKSGYRLAVVCDGLGSKPQSRQGAIKATQAVKSAIAIWMQNGKQKPDRLIRLIHQIWNLLIEPLESTECATTCLFAVVDSSGQGLMAQLGDGIVFWKMPGGHYQLLQAPERDFLNETTGLGIAKSTEEWQWKQISGFGQGHRLLICTDGVSESINTTQLSGFSDWLASSYNWVPQTIANWHLSYQLSNWPNLYHQDDRTLCLLWA